MRNRVTAKPAMGNLRNRQCVTVTHYTHHTSLKAGEDTQAGLFADLSYK